MLTIETVPSVLASLLPQIIAIADADKEALGFLPPSAFFDACSQGRIIAATDVVDGEQEVAGYILYGGIFPRARVYQIGVSERSRRRGTATSLINVLVGRLEAEGYVTLSARVANDLPNALAFYRANEFVPIREIAGGSARSRKLSICVRKLRNDDLFSRLDERHAGGDLLALALRSSAVGDTPFYVIDLNVLFDLIRNRKRSTEARRLFGAALAHRIRLAVSPEFLVELRRTSDKLNDDPVLLMALQLPQLVAAPHDAVNSLADVVHRIVFEEQHLATAGKPQSRSDAKHVAHAALSNASGYITSDGAILRVRDRLRREVGIDVAALSELDDLVLDSQQPVTASPAHGDGFDVVVLSLPDFSAHMRKVGVPEAARKEFAPEGIVQPNVLRLGILQETRIVAVAAMVLPSRSGEAATFFLHSDPRVVASDIFFDALFDRAIRYANSHGPIVIQLKHVTSDKTGSVELFARSRGFLGTAGDVDLFKVGLGGPLTVSNWSRTADILRRRTGLALPETPFGSSGKVRLTLPDQQQVEILYPQLEDLLSPAAIVWPDRECVIQPIGRNFADELLNTGAQSSLLPSRDASFLSRRCYVSSPRSARLMAPGGLIFFYESQRTGGRACIVAVARIVDALVSSKQTVTQDRARRVVIPDLSQFTKGEEVLITSFDNVLTFARPCPLDALRSMGAVGPRNLQSTTAVTSKLASEILEFGWADGTVH